MKEEILLEKDGSDNFKKKDKLLDFESLYSIIFLVGYIF